MLSIKNKFWSVRYRRAPELAISCSVQACPCGKQFPEWRPCKPFGDGKNRKVLSMRCDLHSAWWCRIGRGGGLVGNFRRGRGVDPWMVARINVWSANVPTGTRSDSDVGRWNCRCGCDRQTCCSGYRSRSSRDVHGRLVKVDSTRYNDRFNLSSGVHSLVR